MKKVLSLFVVVFCIHGSFAQQDDREYDAAPVTISTQRRLKDIGEQKTVLDTIALRESITNSLADVLSQNTSIFIKSYGRATLATASFRGTAPSHTQVTWNGMKLNSPMLGMVDFSLIPSYFIDDATLYHGASSVGVTGGGLGGAITLATKPAQEEGFGMRYIQGISSYNTFDEFLRLTYGNRKLQASTRVFYSSSDNDFKYTNYRKKELIYDDQENVIDKIPFKERNKNGAFKDLHILQEAYYNTGNGNRWGFSAWYMNSRRGVPMLNLDYREESQSKNEQNENTLRSTLSWDRLRDNLKLSANIGYTYTDMQYIYLGDKGRDKLSEMIHSRSYVNTACGRFGADYYLGTKWIFSGNVAVHQNFVKSVDRTILSADGKKAVVGYDEARLEATGFLSARYRPTDRWGFAVDLREDMYGSEWTPLIPAAFAEYTISKKGNVIAKASIARNYRYPTLNDLYFMPGGNDSLRTERGFTYDAGVQFSLKSRTLEFRGEATFYDSYIKDWIVWLPTFKGFWSPSNVKEVHSYGLELKGDLTAQLGKGWRLYMGGNYTVTRAINHGDPVNWADGSIGKQLVYIPEYSGAVTGKLSWRNWVFTYKWSHYSERFTTSSNEKATKIGLLEPYYMSDVSLEKSFSFPWAGLSLKFAVNNLFDEEYESVLSRPMAGRNFGFFIELTPRFKKSVNRNR